MLRVRADAPFSRVGFVEYLCDCKIGNRMLFGGNLVRQPTFVQLKRDRPESFRTMGELDGADALMNEAVFVGVYPGLTQAMLDYIIERIYAFVAMH